jgi:hypothetical protein
MLNGLSEIKIFNIQSKINELYQNKNEEYITHNKQLKNNIIKEVISPSISMITEILATIYSIYGFFNGFLTIDTILLLRS